MLRSPLNGLIMVVLLAVAAGCDKAGIEEASPAYDNTEAVEAYYQSHPERFVFSSLAQLPENLNWQDGSDLPSFGDSRAQRGGTLKLRLRTMQQTLRIAGPDANASLREPLWSANSVNLIHMHPWENGFIPGIARQWAIDPQDNRTVYLKLDPDARWSDGRPVTVEDLFFSLYFLLSPDIQDPSLNRVYDELFVRITRYDDETLAITQSRHTPEPLFAVSTLILSQREFYREFGPDYVDRYHWRFAPVTGPYQLDPDKVKRGRQITFERLENWWANDKPFYRHRFNPDKMSYVVIRDDNKAFEAFLKGDIDWHSLTRTSLWYDYEEDASIQEGFIERAWVYNQLPAGSPGIFMNALHSSLEDRNIRLGLQHAMNFERVNDGLYRGDKRRIRSFSDGYGPYSHPTLRARPFDRTKAAAYFKKAGFSSRGSDGVLLDPSGQRLSFVLTISNQGDEVTEALILKEEAQTVGVELIIEVLDPTAFFTKTFEKNHELAIHGWNNGYSSLPIFEWELRGEDAGRPSNFNTTNINVDQLNELLQLWNGLADPVRAQEVAHRVQEQVHEFAAWVPGLTTDYTRLGYWRWVQWPEYFQVPRYFMFTGSGVFWIDQDRKGETLAAQQEDRPFSAVTVVYDRWERNLD
jgi:microcin C transport system substrate-binding protein